MTENLPDPDPRCPKHGPMTLVDPRTLSKESNWCGVWHECKFPEFRCGNSHLTPSKELLAQLDEQRAAHAALIGA